MTSAQCSQWIATDDGSRQCSRKATHSMPHSDKGVCTQHARSYDVPMAPSSVSWVYEYGLEQKLARPITVY